MKPALPAAAPLLAAMVAGAAIAACVSAREEGDAVPRPRARSPADTTIVGRVTPEGRVTADTLTGPTPDAERPERETVFAGVVTPAPDLPAAGPWRVQVHADRDRASADSLAAALRVEFDVPVRVDPQGSWHKVRLGGYASRAEAETLRQRLVSHGWAEAFVVRAP